MGFFFLFLSYLVRLLKNYRKKNERKGKESDEPDK